MTLTVQGPAAARRAAGLPTADFEIGMAPVRQARLHLAFLRLHHPDHLTEIRVLSDRMHQHFFHDVDTAARFAVDTAEDADVYTGVVPRTRRSGGKAAVAGSYVLWAECDTQAATSRAMDMDPPLVVRSSHGKAHCYWPVKTPLDPARLEKANRRLAFHLGADMRATDAARILRVAGTLNHKRGEPERVGIVRLDLDHRRVPVSSLVADLPDPSPPRAIPVRRTQTSAPYDGPLSTVPARVYIERLTGREVIRDMVTCPFHSGGTERTPSLHVGGPNSECWHCFGCGEGGDVFTFAARLWGMDSRRDFGAVKKKLEAIL